MFSLESILNSVQEYGIPNTIFQKSVTSHTREMQIFTLSYSHFSCNIEKFPRQLFFHRRVHSKKGLAKEVLFQYSNIGCKNRSVIIVHRLGKRIAQSNLRGATASCRRQHLTLQACTYADMESNHCRTTYTMREFLNWRVPFSAQFHSK